MEDVKNNSDDEVPEWVDRDDCSTDNEETIEEEESLEQEISTEDELRLLSEDLNKPVTQLLEETRLTTLTKSVNFLSDQCCSTNSCLQESKLCEPELEHQAENDETMPEPSQYSALREFYLNEVLPSVDAKSGSDNEDYEYIPLHKTNKEIKVGKEHQADLDHILNLQESSVKEELMWKPSSDLSEDLLVGYLKMANKILDKRESQEDRGLSSEIVPDEVIALKTLMSCNYVIDDSIDQLSAAANEQELKDTPATVFVSNGRCLATEMGLDDDLPVKITAGRGKYDPARIVLSIN